MKGYLETCDPLDWRQFMIAVKRLADSLGYGTDRSPFRGSGVEFVQSRPYQWGDPIRAVDWRVTARTRRVHVKEYEAPRRMPCYLLLDTSASMMVGAHSPSKYWTALHVAGGLAFACLDRISPVGVMGLGEQDVRIEPSLSRDQILQWLHRLRHYRYDEKTSIGKRIAQLGPSLTTRTLVVVLSDLHDPRAVPALKQLAQSNDCVVLHFRDPAEIGLAGAGLMRAQEAETGRTFVIRGRERWRESDDTAQQLKRAGIDYLLIETNRPFAHTLRQFFRARNLLGRGAR
jgi:uncharacterized protein (DUF58 family)